MDVTVEVQNGTVVGVTNDADGSALNFTVKDTTPAPTPAPEAETPAEEASEEATETPAV